MIKIKVDATMLEAIREALEELEIILAKRQSKKAKKTLNNISDFYTIMCTSKTMFITNE